MVVLVIRRRLSRKVDQAAWLLAGQVEACLLLVPLLPLASSSLPASQAGSLPEASSTSFLPQASAS